VTSSFTQFFYPVLFRRTGDLSHFSKKELVASSRSPQKNWSPVPVLQKRTGYQFPFSKKELVTSSSSPKKNWSPVPVLQKRTGHQFPFSKKELATSSRTENGTEWFKPIPCSVRELS
jgi:hypothetical protein